MDVKEAAKLVKESGFEVPDGKVVKSAIDILEKLGNFMEVERVGDSRERQIIELRDSGVLSEKDAEKALATVKEQRKSAGGIKYDVEFVEKHLGEIEKVEDEKKDAHIRLSLNVHRTTVRNSAKLLRALVEG